VANYILANKQTISFETAASLADKLGVTPITVGRFCRKLGYKNFKEMKEDIKTELVGAPWLKGKELKNFVYSKERAGGVHKSLELEIESIMAVYQMTESPVWSEVVSLLAHKKAVNIVGFQPERSMAGMLTYILQYIRPGVREVNSISGHFSEVLLEESSEQCLVIVDIRRYSTHSYKLAEKAYQADIPIIIIADNHCDWGRKFTPYVLMCEREVGLFWTSPVSMACLINLLLNDVVKELGTVVEERLSAVSSLYQDFIGHVGQVKSGLKKPE
jgi:DNA-binding MurR/RpiR family transcriptional regulator